jgi:hypothetical protein
MWRVLIGLDEIAEALRCSRRQVTRYIHQKGLPVMRRRGVKGRTWCTTTGIIDQWITAQSNARHARTDKV